MDVDIDKVPVPKLSRTASAGSQTPSAPLQAGPNPKPNQTNPKIEQSSKPQPGASAVGSDNKSQPLKKKVLSDRQPKGSEDPIAQANGYLLLPDDPGDVEMAEAAPRGPLP